MASLLPARLSRLAIPALALLLSTAGLTSAAGTQDRTGSSLSTASASAAPQRVLLVVPDVRGQAYVFAKGILADSGFAWKVQGAVSGFPANFVAGQSPFPGTRLVDTGAPTITLRLDRNAKYAENGSPENFSPFAGTRVLRPSAARNPVRKHKAAKHVTRRSAKKHVVRKAKAAPKASKRAVHKKKASTPKRPPEFRVPGAPKEPLNEMPLPRRARLLGAWLTKHPRPTDANVKHWVYQHAWIVTGAKFGWWHGAEALRTLIAVDRRVVRTWGVGARSLTTARSALAEVKARAR